VLSDLLNGNIEEQEYLILNNARIVYKKLPKKIYGFIHRYRDINLITINWNVSKKKKKKAILHELAHLELHHLDKNSELFAFSIENTEDEADKYIKNIIENIDSNKKRESSVEKRQSLHSAK